MNLRIFTSCLLLLFAGFVGGAVADESKLLMSTEALEAAIDTVLPVDTRDARAFADGHIPGAAHLHFSTLSETRDGVPGMLLPPRELRRLLAESGLDPERPLVLYSGMESPDDFKMAARLFFVLEYMGYSDIAVLDGGLRKWTAEDRPVATGASEVASLPLTRIPLAEHPDILLEKAAVLARLDQDGVVLSDQRSEAAYRGEILYSPGHIPGAHSQPLTEFMEGAHHTFKRDAALNRLTDAGRDADTIITYCNTGHTGAVGYFAYRLAGYDNVALYDGSMQEWMQDDSLPISSGAE